MSSLTEQERVGLRKLAVIDVYINITSFFAILISGVTFAFVHIYRPEEIFWPAVAVVGAVGTDLVSFGLFVYRLNKANTYK